MFTSLHLFFLHPTFMSFHPPLHLSVQLLSSFQTFLHLHFLTTASIIHCYSSFHLYLLYIPVFVTLSINIPPSFVRQTLLHLCIFLFRLLPFLLHPSFSNDLSFSWNYTFYPSSVVGNIPPCLSPQWSLFHFVLMWLKSSLLLSSSLHPSIVPPFTFTFIILPSFLLSSFDRSHIRLHLIPPLRYHPCKHPSISPDTSSDYFWGWIHLNSTSPTGENVKQCRQSRASTGADRFPFRIKAADRNRSRFTRHLFDLLSLRQTDRQTVAVWDRPDICSLHPNTLHHLLSSCDRCLLLTQPGNLFCFTADSSVRLDDSMLTC